jgi:hypothetical protein
MSRWKRARWWLTGFAILLGLVAVVCLAVQPPGWDEWGDAFLYGAVAVGVVCGILWNWI